MTSLDDELDRPRLPSGAWWINEDWEPIDAPAIAQPRYLNGEQAEILGTFCDLLRAPTGDGAAKRARGEKVLWKFDTTHRDAMMRHLTRWIEGEDYDETSGAPALAHVAWRALALAYQQLDRDGRLGKG